MQWRVYIEQVYELLNRKHNITALKKATTPFFLDELSTATIENLSAERMRRCDKQTETNLLLSFSAICPNPPHTSPHPPLPASQGRELQLGLNGV